MVRRRFDLAVRRFGLNRLPWTLDTGKFERPAKDPRQFKLL
jgi:hypothetical protein